MFKHILSLALAITFVFSFAACAEKPEAVSTETATATNTADVIKASEFLKLNPISFAFNYTPKYIDPQNIVTEYKNKEEIESYFRKDLTSLELSGTPAEGFVYDGDESFKLTYNKSDMSRISDKCYFSYSKNEKSFTVIASKNFITTYFPDQSINYEPTFFTLPDKSVQEVTVGYKEKDKYCDYDLYIAEFKQNFMYFEIDGKNVTEEEFYYIISAVLNAQTSKPAKLSDAPKKTKLTTPDSAIYYSNGQKTTLSKDKAKAIANKLNYYLINGKNNVPSLWVIEETAGKVKNEQKCVELIYNTEQKSQNIANSVWNFNKLLIILDGKDKGMIMHAENGAYTGSAATIFDESFTKDILSIINEGG